MSAHTMLNADLQYCKKYRIGPVQIEMRPSLTRICVGKIGYCVHQQAKNQ